MTVEELIHRKLEEIKDPKDRETIGGILHEVFLGLMINSALQECDPTKKAATQEVLAIALNSVMRYTQKPRMATKKPVVAMTAPPSTT